MYSGSSHITMLIAGGIGFILIGLLNDKFPPNKSIIFQMMITALIITAVELTTGLIVNVWLHYNVWSYRMFPYNLWGQICPYFSILWFILSLPAILLDDLLRYRIFKGDKKKHKYWI
nr:hypothetical protein [Anaeromicropila herbilytica]